MIDEQSSASGHDYASDRSAIGAGWLVGEEIANIKYKSLLGLLLRRRGAPNAASLRIGGNATYDSGDIFTQLLTCLAKVLEDELLAALKASP